QRDLAGQPGGGQRGQVDGGERRRQQLVGPGGRGQIGQLPECGLARLAAVGRQIGRRGRAHRQGGGHTAVGRELGGQCFGALARHRRGRRLTTDPVLHR